MSQVPIRNKMQRMFDMTALSSMYLRGVRQVDMAKELKVSVSTIERDLSKLRAQWEDASVYNFHSAKSEQLAKIDEIERAAWAAYESSRLERRKVTHFDEQVNPPKEVAMTHSKIDPPMEDLSKEELMMIAQRRKVEAAIATESAVIEGELLE